MASIALKAHVLADFVIELTLISEVKIEQKMTWNVWVNKAASANGSRIKIIREGPHNIKYIKYTACLNF